MGNFIDLTGKRFGRLTVIKRASAKGESPIFWQCRCDCGNIKNIAAGNLSYGHTQSCGCLRSESITASHFLSRNKTRKDNPRLLSIWKGMIRRCYNADYIAYHNYGGRGITVCDEWLCAEGFSNFVEWALKNGYSDNLTIDRIDFNGNYTPQNCRWVTIKANANNKRNNRYIQYNGETKTLSEWADTYGMTQTELKRRLDTLGLPIGIALTMDGLPRTYYKGRYLCIRHIAQKNNIDYKTLLHAVLVQGRSADDVVSELSDQQTRMGIERLMQQMEQ